MIILYLDHFTILQLPASDRGDRLRTRLRAGPVADGLIRTTIVNVEESMLEWMASIAYELKPLRQIGWYRELGKLFEFFAAHAVAPLDLTAAYTSVSTTAR